MSEAITQTPACIASRIELLCPSYSLRSKTSLREAATEQRRRDALRANELWFVTESR